MAGRVVVVGGGLVGASVARALAVEDGRRGVVVVERDPGYRTASTALSAAGIRQQFTTRENIRLSRHGVAFLRRYRTPSGERIAFAENGYLILVGDAAQAAGLRAAHALQREEGADVALLTPAELSRRFPHLATGDLALASLGLSGEGWFDAMGLLAALREETRAAGVEWLRDEATGLDVETEAGGARRVTGVRLASGATLGAEWVVDAAGVRAARVAGWAGVALPVEPRKRTAFAFACARPPEGRERLPLMADPTGLWCRPEGAGFIAGRAPEPADDPAVDPEDVEPRSTEFEERVWPVLAARSTSFEAIRMTGLWAGHYAWNTVDRNAILGPAPGVANLLLACGFSGHGVQQAPGVGRALADRIGLGRWGALDLSALEAGRLDGGAPAAEAAVY